MNQSQHEAFKTLIRAYTAHNAGILIADELPDGSIFKQELKQQYNRCVSELNKLETVALKHIDAFVGFIEPEKKSVIFQEAERIANELIETEVNITITE